MSMLSTREAPPAFEFSANRHVASAGMVVAVVMGLMALPGGALLGMQGLVEGDVGMVLMGCFVALAGLALPAIAYLVSKRRVLRLHWNGHSLHVRWLRGREATLRPADLVETRLVSVRQLVGLRTIEVRIVSVLCHDGVRIVVDDNPRSNGSVNDPRAVDALIALAVYAHGPSKLTRFPQPPRGSATTEQMGA